MIRNALISVSDKTGLAEFARPLAERKVQIYSTGGTLKYLQNHNINARSITEVTQFPEVLDGRVKTLHPRIFSGILARQDDEAHQQQMNELDLPYWDLVVVNLYPFEKTVASQAPHSEIIENIDIGGPTLVRAAAKNYEHTLIVTDINDYQPLLEEIENGAVSNETRLYLAHKAFRRVMQYDMAIDEYFSQKKQTDILTLQEPLAQPLRYGENPHQQAAIYGDMSLYFKQLHGKALSYNNLNDALAAGNLISDFSQPTVAILKHCNPCGVASHANLGEAYRQAFAADTRSPFGGIVAVNQPADESLALEIKKVFTEIIIAPAYTEKALAILQKKKNLRILKATFPWQNQWEYRGCDHLILRQQKDAYQMQPQAWETVSKRTPTAEEMEAAAFAMTVVKHLRSNAIAISQGTRIAAMGPGQQSRIDAMETAVRKAETFNQSLKGAVLASDAFFPFPDVVELAAQHGITAIVHPGGSKNDAASIEACDRYGLAMILTHHRHFKH